MNIVLLPGRTLFNRSHCPVSQPKQLHLPLLGRQLQPMSITAQHRVRVTTKRPKQNELLSRVLFYWTLFLSTYFCVTDFISLKILKNLIFLQPLYFE